MENPGPFDQMTNVQKKISLASREETFGTDTATLPFAASTSTEEGGKGSKAESQGPPGLNLERRAQKAKEKDPIGLQLHMRLAIIVAILAFTRILIVRSGLMWRQDLAILSPEGPATVALGRRTS